MINILAISTSILYLITLKLQFLPVVGVASVAITIFTVMAGDLCTLQHFPNAKHR